MDITPPLLAGSNFINGYSDKGFKVNGQWITNHLILAPGEHYPWELTENIFAVSNYHDFIENLPSKDKTNSIVLIGTGAVAETPSIELFEFFKGHGIFPEVMSTAAACRTYNVLVAEQRCVFALLKKV